MKIINQLIDLPWYSQFAIIITVLLVIRFLPSVIRMLWTRRFWVIQTRFIWDEDRRLTLAQKHIARFMNNYRNRARSTIIHILEHYSEAHDEFTLISKPNDPLAKEDTRDIAIELIALHILSVSYLEQLIEKLIDELAEYGAQSEAQQSDYNILADYMENIMDPECSAYAVVTMAIETYWAMQTKLVDGTNVYEYCRHMYDTFKQGSSTNEDDNLVFAMKINKDNVDEIINLTRQNSNITADKG